MSKRLRLPAKIIAYVMESFDGLPHGHYMKRLPAVECVVGGNRYNAFPAPSENAVIIVIAYSDAERNLFHERARIAKEQHSKAHGKLAIARKGYGDASAAAARLSGIRQQRAEGARVQFEDQVNAAEREVERLKAIIDDMDARILDWQSQESMSVLASEWNANTFLLSMDDEIAEVTDTSLETVKDLLRAGDAFAVKEIRMVMPPEELSLEQVEAFLLEQDKTENKSRISHIVQKIKEGREIASPRSEVPVVQPDSPVAGEPKPEAGGVTEPVSVMQGAAPEADKPGELPADPVKSNRRK